LLRKYKFGSSPKEMIQMKGSRSRGFKGPSEILNSFKEAISTIGYWFKVKAGLRFNPQEYCSILRS